MENKINEMWLARNKDGDLAMYENKPFKSKLAEQWICSGWFEFLPKDRFPEVQWSNEEPTKVKLIIDRF